MSRFSLRTESHGKLGQVKHETFFCFLNHCLKGGKAGMKLVQTMI